MSARTRSIYIIILSCLISLSTPLPTSLAASQINPDEYTKEIKPLPEHSRVVGEIIRDLKRNHYRKLAIDDALSAKTLGRYLAEVDATRLYFTASDIREFEQYRTRLDDSLLRGDVTPAFRIFNRYQDRIAQRLIFNIRYTDSGFKDLSLEQDDAFNTDREDAPWPATRTDLENLWLKALKNEAINMRLDGKTMQEAASALSKRYWSQLKRLRLTTSEDVFQIFMNALAESYDPHTAYFSPRSSENFNINMSLSLEGIGAMLTMENEYTKVVRLVPAGPADKAKLLKPNDRIIGVGQGTIGEIVDVVGWRLDDVVDLIRGPKNTYVRLKVIPADASDDHQTKTVRIMRGTVKLEEQAASRDIIEIKRNGRTFKIGIIHIPTFYLDIKGMQSDVEEYKSTTRDVKRILGDLATAKVDGIIIDLRDNGGGSLHEANTLTGLFIKRGPTVQIRSVDGDTETLYDRDPSIIYNGPLAVIINRLSASASEIFAGAIQDYGRGIVIGDNSFGKGTVQTLLNLSQGQLKITTSKFYRISGESTQHRGIIPDLFYPSLYDKESIGESSLKNALAWDAIDAVPHYTYSDLTPVKSQLRSLHTNRSRNDPDYNYFIEMNRFLKEAKGKKTVSLKLSARIQEKKSSEEGRLTLENKLRKAKGLKPVTRVEQLDEGKDESQRTKPAKDDPELVESGDILVDFITIRENVNGSKQAKNGDD